MSAVEPHVKRPMNAFMIWSSRKRRELARKNPKLHNSQISKILGTEWRNLTAEERQKFFAQAKLLNELHLIEHPGYKYRPKRRLKRKQVKQKPANHGVCSFSSCFCSETSTGQGLDHDRYLREENAQMQKIHEKEPIDNGEAIFYKEKTGESVSSSENTPDKDNASDSALWPFNLHSRASENPFLAKYENSGSNVTSQGPRSEVLKDSVTFREEHLAMLRTNMPSYYPPNVLTPPYQPPCHIFTGPFSLDREAAARFLPAYPASRCNCCQSDCRASEEDFLITNGTQYAFFNPPTGSQYLYGRRWWNKTMEAVTSSVDKNLISVTQMDCFLWFFIKTMGDIFSSFWKAPHAKFALWC